jgi:hypothetical protein
MSLAGTKSPALLQERARRLTRIGLKTGHYKRPAQAPALHFWSAAACRRSRDRSRRGKKLISLHQFENNSFSVSFIFICRTKVSLPAGSLTLVCKFPRITAEDTVIRSQGVQDNQAGLLIRIMFWFAKRRLGHVPLGARIRAFDPKYMRHALRLDLYGIASGTVSMHLREIAQLKVALMVGCPF